MSLRSPSPTMDACHASFHAGALSDTLADTAMLPTCPLPPTPYHTVPIMPIAGALSLPPAQRSSNPIERDRHDLSCIHATTAASAAITAATSDPAPSLPPPHTSYTAAAIAASIGLVHHCAQMAWSSGRKS